MNIVFNGIVSNLGNNGGSRTILESIRILNELGHIADIIAVVDNFTWFEHRQPINFLPHNTDAVINIAAVDYRSTLNIPVEKKFTWWRGHEIWSTPENILIELYRDERIKNIVNSKGLQHKFNTEFHAKSVVVYQGIDFDMWEDRKLRGTEKIRIGCLSSKRHATKRWEDFVELAEVLGHDDYEYVAFGLENRDDGFLTNFLQNPGHDELVDFYSSCHIWVAPTELEGLHNPAIEASLCGCLLVANDNPMNGMVLDYAFDGQTAMVYEARNLNDAAEKIRNANWGLVPEMQEYIRTNIGSRKDNMKKMVKYLEGL